MPSPTDQPPQTLAQWLLDDPDRAAQSTEAAITERLRTSSSRILAQLGQIARASVGRQVVDALAMSIPNDLVEVFRKIWGDYRALLEVGADSARRAPDQRTMHLKDQDVTFERESSVAVFVRGRPVLTLAGQVEVVLALGKIEAVVRSGQLLRVQAGQAFLKATIRVEDQEVVTKDYVWPLEGFLIEFDPTVDLASWSLPMVSPQYQ